MHKVFWWRDARLVETPIDTKQLNQIAKELASNHLQLAWKWVFWYSGEEMQLNSVQPQQMNKNYPSQRKE